MTTEEELRKKAGIPEFEERFRTHIKDLAERDAQQEIGHKCDPHFDRGGDFDRQLNEKIEQVDREHRADAAALEVQNDKEIVAFGAWMKGQRDMMRAEDVAAQPDKAAPRLVPAPGFGPSGSQNAPQKEPVKDFAQRESLRNDAGETMRQQFDAFQSQRHDNRLDALNERDVQNREQLKEAHGQMVEGRRAAYEKPLPWESPEQAKASAEKAMKLVQEYNGHQKDREWNSGR